MTGSAARSGATRTPVPIPPTRFGTVPTPPTLQRTAQARPVPAPVLTPAVIQRAVVVVQGGLGIFYRNRHNAEIGFEVRHEGDVNGGRFLLRSRLPSITLTTPDNQTSTLLQMPEGVLNYSKESIRKREVTAFCFADTMIDTLAISTMDAKPNGQGLGNVLVYHLADLAVQNGVEYVTAKNVVTRANMFYQRLGFRPFRSQNTVLTDRGWQAGTDLAAWYQNFRQAQNQAYLNANPQAQPGILARTLAVADVLAANHMFVSAATLRTNAGAAWAANWQRV